MATNELSIPQGVTKKGNFEVNYAMGQKGLSKDVVEALRMLDYGFKDISSFTKTMSKNDQKQFEETKQLVDIYNKYSNELNSTNKEVREMAEKLSHNEAKELSREYKIEQASREDLKNFMEKSQKVFEKNNDAIKGQLLGSLSVITSPFEQFFGFDLGNIFTNKLFGKNAKKNPKESDVAKIGGLGAGFLLINSTLRKAFGVTEGPLKEGLGEKILQSVFKTPLEGGFLKNIMLGGGFGGKNLSKGANIANKVGSGLAIAGGVAMAGKDAIEALNANWVDEQGKELSKGAKAFGGFFGGLGSGFEGAISNLGKWALTGFGIGNLIFPGIGGLVGGAIGALLGGILGFIGGEKIAQFGQKMGNWFVNVGTVLWTVTKEAFIEGYHYFIDFWGGIGKKIGDWFKNTWINFVSMMTNVQNKIISTWVKSKEFVIGIGKSIGKFFMNIFGKIGNVLGKTTSFVKNVVGNVVDSITSIFNGISWNSDENVLTNIKNIAVTLFGNIKNGIISFFTENPIGVTVKETVFSLFEKISDGINTFFTENPLGKKLNEWIVEPMKKAFNQIGLIFNFIKSLSLKDVWSIMTSKEDTWASRFDEFSKTVNVEDAVIKPDGTVIKTNPNDTLVALKDIDTSMSSIRNQTNENMRGLSYGDGSLEKKVDVIVSVLNKILNKEPVQLMMPQQTRTDLDLIMNGGLL